MVTGGSPCRCIARTGVKVAERLGGQLPSPPRAQQAVGPPQKGGVKALLGCSGGQLNWGRAPGGLPPSTAAQLGASLKWERSQAVIFPGLIMEIFN